MIHMTLLQPADFATKNPGWRSSDKLNSSCRVTTRWSWSRNRYSLKSRQWTKLVMHIKTTMMVKTRQVIPLWNSVHNNRQRHSFKAHTCLFCSRDSHLKRPSHRPSRRSKSITIIVRIWKTSSTTYSKRDPHEKHWAMERTCFSLEFSPIWPTLATINKFENLFQNNKIKFRWS